MSHLGVIKVCLLLKAGSSAVVLKSKLQNDQHEGTFCSLFSLSWSTYLFSLSLLNNSGGLLMLMPDCDLSLNVLESFKMLSQSLMRLVAINNDTCYSALTI